MAGDPVPCLRFSRTRAAVETMPGVRPRGFGLRASLKSTPAVFGGGARRGRPDQERQRNGGGGGAPGPLPSSPPPISTSSEEQLRVGGSAQDRLGEGPAWPAELLLCMTQWFLKKALMGSPE